MALVACRDCKWCRRYPGTDVFECMKHEDSRGFEPYYGTEIIHYKSISKVNTDGTCKDFAQGDGE